MRGKSQTMTTPLLLALALGALHPAPSPGSPAPPAYSCEMVRETRAGELKVLVSGMRAGGETHYRVSWSSRRVGSGPGLNLDWHGLAEPGEETVAYLYFMVRRRVGNAYVALSANGGRARLNGSSAGADSGPGGRWVYSSRFQWPRLEQMVLEQDRVAAALMPHEGPIQASGRIDTAMVEAPAAALLAARDAVERMARERRCGSGGRLRI
jgi:hypothetical protein